MSEIISLLKTSCISIEIISGMPNLFTLKHGQSSKKSLYFSKNKPLHRGDIFGSNTFFIDPLYPNFSP